MIREYLKKIIPVTCIVIFVAFAAVVGQASVKEYASNQYADMTGQEDTEAEETTEVTTEAPAQVVAEPQPEPEVVEPVPEPEPEVVEPEPEPEPIVEAPQPDPTIRICIDPGHGGGDTGTRWEYDGTMIEEKNLNYRIATTLKSYLEQYSNVQVIITRSASDSPGKPSDRVKYAVANNADYLVSVHINSKSRDDLDAHGCMVLMTCSRYQPANTKVASLYDTELAMAQNIIANLNGLGIPFANDWDADKNGGLLQRVGDGTYPDGSPADYYGIVYNGSCAGIPSIIVEHAFLSSENDYRDYLDSDEKLDALARADANGIASALGLQ